MSVAIMDALKYIFDIDPVSATREKLRLTKKTSKMEGEEKKKPPEIIRYIHARAPPKKSSEQPISTVEETTVSQIEIFLLFSFILDVESVSILSLYFALRFPVS